MNRSSRRSSSSFFAHWCLPAAFAALLVCLPAMAHADTLSFSITGKGWGHGIGLSQYGAQGYAKSGWTYDRILAWYYQGTTLGPSAAKAVRVNLDKDKARRGSWTLRSGWEGQRLIVNGEAMPADHTFVFTAVGTQVQVRDADAAGEPLLLSGTVNVGATAPAGQPALVQVVDASGPYGYALVRYRGTLALDANGTGLRLADVLDIEDYLLSVVPREMPASWHAEALKAQSVAARSYAYVATGELYCDTRSQMYAGHSRGLRTAANASPLEDARSTAAITATRGRVVLDGGKVVQTFFFSYSGGRTANVEDVWTSSTPRRCYSTVADADVAGGAPASWGAPVVLTSAAMGTELTAYDGDAAKAVPVVALACTPAPSGSGFVKYVDVTFATGRVVRITGDQFRSALGLKSTKFAIDRIGLASGTTSLPGWARVQNGAKPTQRTGSGWTTRRSSLHSGGSYIRTSGTGAKVIVPFEGTGVRWISPVARGFGLADVYIDGVKVARVNLYSYKTAYRRVVWSREGLAPGAHTLVIRATGLRDRRATGRYIGFDAADVMRVPASDATTSTAPPAP